jgi:hypothetical protein
LNKATGQGLSLGTETGDESNAAMLGKIDDNDLREKIIRVYGSSKSLFEF